MSSETASREGQSRRSLFRKAHSEAALPPEYLEQLEQKRKQLDESIHKYIAAKEREYKQFEKEVRQQHKTSQGQDASNVSTKRRPSLDSQNGDQTARLEAERIAVADAIVRADVLSRKEEDQSMRAAGQSTAAKLKERGFDLNHSEVFQASLLSAQLTSPDEKGQRYRAVSNPIENIQHDGVQHPIIFERSNSDSLTQAKSIRPALLSLAHRNSSSGSSVDGRLASAMKSPKPAGKRKRVSLAVGDAIVAPSEEVPEALNHHSAPSHSRVRSPVPDQEAPGSTKRISPPPLDSLTETADPRAENAATTNVVSECHGQLRRLPPPAMPTSAHIASQLSSSLARADPDGDFFDLDDDSDTAGREPDSVEDDDENAIESDEDDVDGHTGDHQLKQEAVHGLPEPMEDVQPGKSTAPDPTLERYDATTGGIPEPADGTDSAVPYLSFGSLPARPLAAQQPPSPGFRRPSVVCDPVYVGANYQANERKDEEKYEYSSSFNKPSSKSSFTAGSLGESYMAQHAEAMKALRLTKRRAEVR